MGRRMVGGHPRSKARAQTLRVRFRNRAQREQSAERIKGKVKKYVVSSYLETRRAKGLNRVPAKYIQYWEINMADIQICANHHSGKAVVTSTSEQGRKWIWTNMSHDKEVTISIEAIDEIKQVMEDAALDVDVR